MDRVWNLVDPNQDGKITLDEVENEAERIKHKVSAATSPVVRFCEDHSRWLQAGVGWVTLLYGGHFKQTMLFYCGFETTQRDVLLAQLAELREMYSTARSKVKKEYGEVVLASYGESEGATGSSAHESGERRQVPLGLVLYRAIDPHRLLNLARCLYSGLCVGLAATMNESAAKLGLGVQLGRRLSDWVSPAVERLARPPGRPGEDPPAPDPWLLLAAESACTGIGLMATHMLKGWAALWTTTSIGSDLLVEAVIDILGNDWVPAGSQLMLTLQTSKVVLAGYGFYSQLVNWGRSPIPWFLQLPLAPVRILEATLSLVGPPAAVAQVQ